MFVFCLRAALTEPSTYSAGSDGWQQSSVECSVAGCWPGVCDGARIGRSPAERGRPGRTHLRQRIPPDRGRDSPPDTGEPGTRQTRIEQLRSNHTGTVQHKVRDRTHSIRTLFCRTLTVRWPHYMTNENKLTCNGVSYLQPRFTKVTTECITDSF